MKNNEKMSHAMIQAVINIICSIITLILIIVYLIFGIKPVEPYESSSIPEITTTVSETTNYITANTSYTSGNNITRLTTTSETEITTETSYDPAYTTFIGWTVTTKDQDPIIVITDYDIIVIPDKPKNTIKTTALNFSQTTYTTTLSVEDEIISKEFVKTFSKGTYYCYEQTGVKGGSGRTLVDCSVGTYTIKGSVACRYIYNLYGYRHGSHTVVYLEIPDYPDMNGYYFVDDCCASYNVIDFYYDYKNNCPFKDQGVLSNINCYIVN